MRKQVERFLDAKFFGQGSGLQHRADALLEFFAALLRAVPPPRCERESANFGSLALCLRLLRFHWRPPVRIHVNSCSVERDAFGFQQLSLFQCLRLRHEQTPARANYAMPRNALAIRARRHGVAHGSRTTAKL